MKNILPLILIVFLINSCKKRFKPEINNHFYSKVENYFPHDTLYRISSNQYYEIGDDFVYVNKKGDTLINDEKFVGSFSDTIVTFGIVIDKMTSDIIGINRDGKRIFEIYKYDNGPDHYSDDLIRIIQNGKIGYADRKGRIVIKPQYGCASVFINGIANVTDECVLYNDLENHISSESENWYKIDKKGIKVE